MQGNPNNEASRKEGHPREREREREESQKKKEKPPGLNVWVLIQQWSIPRLCLLERWLAAEEPARP